MLLQMLACYIQTGSRFGLIKATVWSVVHSPSHKYLDLDKGDLKHGPSTVWGPVIISRLFIKLLFILRDICSLFNENTQRQRLKHK